MHDSPLRHRLVLPALLSAMIAMTQLSACQHRINPSILDPDRLAPIDAAIESFIDRRQMPGAVYWLERRKGQESAVYQKAYGRHTYDANAEKITLDTVFDAASLTKVIATAPSVMLLIEEGKLKIDAPLIEYFPECTGGGKDAITLRHLLTHTSGLAAGLPSTPVWRGEAAALALACKQTVTHPPGTFFRYSDINFTLLGILVQRIGGMPLDQFATRRLFAPLGMRDTGYLPLKRIPRERIAPTQQLLDRATQKLHGDLADGGELRGVVHDPTVRFMGGVGGSAGVFITAADLARYARMIVNDGIAVNDDGSDGVRVLSRESVRLMHEVQSPTGITELRSAGWDIHSPFSRPRGRVFPIGSFGHTGFTGCILWIDPYSKTFFVFLSNRVYPNDRGNILDLYGQLGTLSAQAVAGVDFSAPAAK